MGQIAIRPTADGYALTHVEDVGREGLSLHREPTDARRLATYDDAGGFRPLKTAPTLRHGWELIATDVAALRTALEGFYPAMLGTLLSFKAGELQCFDLNATLARQSGMYAITKRLTEGQADELISRVCCSPTGCLKTILWRISPERAISSLPPEKFDPAAAQFPASSASLPMLCAESCNLLVAAAREVVKKAAPPPE